MTQVLRKRPITHAQYVRAHRSHQDIYGSSAHFAVSIEQVSRHEFLYQTGQDSGNAQADIPS